MSPSTTPRDRSAPPRIAPFACAITAVIAALAAPLALPVAAGAHGFSSVVYVDASDSADADVRTVLELEYDLLVVSVADFEGAPAFFEDGMAVFETGDEASALNAHPDEIVAYVTERFTVYAGADVCHPEQVGDLSTTVRDGTPYAALTLDFACESSAAIEFRSELFPDSEEYVQARSRSSTTTSTDERAAPRQQGGAGVQHRAAGAGAVLALLRPGRGASAVRDRPHPLPARPCRRIAAAP